MKQKYKIIDLSNNPEDLEPGDMVKLRKGLKVGEAYCDLIFLSGMRYRYYKTITTWRYKGVYYKSIRLANDLVYTVEMLDLTCVKRRITNDDKR